MYEIVFKPANRKVVVAQGTPLMEAARLAGIKIRSECAGQGRCGKCLVNVIPNPHPSSGDLIKEVNPLILKDYHGQQRACQSVVDRPLQVWVVHEAVESEILEAKTRNVESINRELSARINHHLPGKSHSLGFAIDMGTTTIAAYLADRSHGNVLAAQAVLNPQVQYGADVISRISMANQRRDGLRILQRLAVQAVNQLVRSCLDKVQAIPDAVDDVVVVGNTTMEYLLAGIHPRSIGEVPYMPTILEIPDQNAEILEVELPSVTPFHFFPVKTGYIGGDLLAAILAEGAHLRDQPCLIIDLGTNGEAALVTPQCIWVTSCATGPAFEGGQLACGMRAGIGAIHKVTPADHELGFNCSVIGANHGAMAAGICGSGIIDAVAVMREAGVILPNGRFNEKRTEIIADKNGIGRKMVLIPPEKSTAQDGVFITLHDIRQVQLAKAAVAIGIESLMQAAEVDHVEKTVLTGAFGARFDWRNAIAIGMFPEALLKGRVMVADNLAGLGALVALLDKYRRPEIESIYRNMQHIELASQPRFADRFAQATRFPSPR